MSSSLTVDEVRSCVCEQLAVVLAVPRDSIRQGSRILIDLGAESLDLVDLSFRLEDALHIRLDPKELNEASDHGGAPEDFPEHFTVDALTGYLLVKLERANANP